MRLTITNEEAKILRIWLRLALESALSGPNTEAVMSNTSHNPEIIRKYRSDKLLCEKMVVTVRGLLKRLKP